MRALTDRQTDGRTDRRMDATKYIISLASRSIIKCYTVRRVLDAFIPDSVKGKPLEKRPMQGTLWHWIIQHIVQWLHTMLTVTPSSQNLGHHLKSSLKDYSFSSWPIYTILVSKFEEIWPLFTWHIPKLIHNLKNVFLMGKMTATNCWQPCFLLLKGWWKPFPNWLITQEAHGFVYGYYTWWGIIIPYPEGM